MFFVVIYISMWLKVFHDMLTYGPLSITNGPCSYSYRSIFFITTARTKTVVHLSMKNEVVWKLVHASNNGYHFSIGMPSSNDIELSNKLQPFRNFI